MNGAFLAENHVIFNTDMILCTSKKIKHYIQHKKGEMRPDALKGLSSPDPLY